jgi:O-antigen/teichoic acid export membrane protein
LQRYRRAALGGGTAALNGGLKMLGSLVTMPLVLHYLGAERFGVWVTLASFMALVSVGDLGIGNGLINALSAAHGTDDRISARMYVSSAFFMLLAFSSVLLLFLIALDAVVPWPAVFNLTSPIAIAEVGPAIKIVSICIFLKLVVGIVGKVRFGYQEVHINSLWDTGSVVLSFCALVIFVWREASLPWLVLAETGAYIVLEAANCVSLFFVERPWLRPSWSCASFDAARNLFNLGILFFVLHLAGIVAFSSDNLLAIWACGPEAAGVYAIAFKLFSPCRLLAATVQLPLWPAYGEAIARGDIAWVRRIVVRSMVAAEVIVVPLALGIFFFGDELASLWLQRPVSLGYWLLGGVALWVVLESIGFGCSYFLNGASAIRVQVALSICFAPAAVVARLALAAQFGISGIIWGTVLAYSIAVLLPYTWIVPRQIRELMARAQQDAIAT